MLFVFIFKLFVFILQLRMFGVEIEYAFKPCERLHTWSHHISVTKKWFLLCMRHRIPTWYHYLSVINCFHFVSVVEYLPDTTIYFRHQWFPLCTRDRVPTWYHYISVTNGFHCAYVIEYLPDTTIYPSPMVSTLYTWYNTYLIPPYIRHQWFPLCTRHRVPTWYHYISVTNGFHFVHVIEYLPDTTIYPSPMVSTLYTSYSSSLLSKQSNIWFNISVTCNGEQAVDNLVKPTILLWRMVHSWNFSAVTVSFWFRRSATGSGTICLKICSLCFFSLFKAFVLKLKLRITWGNLKTNQELMLLIINISAKFFFRYLIIYFFLKKER